MLFQTEAGELGAPGAGQVMSPVGTPAAMVSSAASGSATGRDRPWEERTARARQRTGGNRLWNLARNRWWRQSMTQGYEQGSKWKEKVPLSYLKYEETGCSLNFS